MSATRSADGGDGGGSSLVAASPSKYLPVAAASGFGSLADILKDNLGGEQMSQFDLERVRVPAGGGTFWSVSSLENPSGVPTPEVVGVIAHTRIGRAYWSDPLEKSGGGTAPDCSSDDGVTGFGRPGGSCHQCPMASWGSDPKGGKGQACKTARLLFMLSPDAMLPRVVVCPPGSLKALKGYLSRLSSVGRPYWSVATSLKLEKAVSSGGITYARIVPSMVETLTPEAVAVVRQYVEALGPVFSQVRVDRGEVDGTSE